MSMYRWTTGPVRPGPGPGPAAPRRRVRSPGRYRVRSAAPGSGARTVACPDPYRRAGPCRYRPGCPVPARWPGVPPAGAGAPGRPAAHAASGSPRQPPPGEQDQQGADDERGGAGTRDDRQRRARPGQPDTTRLGRRMRGGGRRRGRYRRGVLPEAVAHRRAADAAEHDAGDGIAGERAGGGALRAVVDGAEAVAPVPDVGRLDLLDRVRPGQEAGERPAPVGTGGQAADHRDAAGVLPAQVDPDPGDPGLARIAPPVVVGIGEDRAVDLRPGHTARLVDGEDAGLVGGRQEWIGVADVADAVAVAVLLARVGIVGTVVDLVGYLVAVQRDAQVRGGRRGPAVVVGHPQADLGEDGLRSDRRVVHVGQDRIGVRGVVRAVVVEVPLVLRDEAATRGEAAGGVQRDRVPVP